MIHETTMNVRSRDALAPAKLMIVFSVAVVVIGLLIAPERVWANMLLVGFYAVGVGIGSLAFVAIHHATGAGWSTVVRRVAEAVAVLIPVGGAIVLLTLIAGGSTIFPWFHMDSHAHGFKAWWLTPWFVIARGFVYVAIWMAWLGFYRRHSIAQDRDRELQHSIVSRKWSPLFLISFGFTISLASVDWIMSLEMAWFSTMFGLYHFSGLFVAALAVIIIVTITLRESGRLPGVNQHHIHDLGKLLFAFSTFWMYIWFSQYMLIWYSNLAEETTHFSLRSGAWAPLMATNVLLNWIVPFLLLMAARAKMSERRLRRIAIVILVGHWIDLYLSIHPSLFGSTPVFGGWEVGIGLGGFALAFLMIARTLDRAATYPIGDPLLDESLHHHG